MGTSVKVTRQDMTSAELRAAACKCADGAQVRRMLAVALVLGRSFFAPYASVAGQALLCLYAAMYTGALVVLSRRSRPRRRDRILVRGPGRA